MRDWNVEIYGEVLTINAFVRCPRPDFEGLDDVQVHDLVSKKAQPRISGGFKLIGVLLVRRTDSTAELEMTYKKG